MSEVVASGCFSKAQSAVFIADTAKCHHRDIAITVGKCAWLSTEHLKIPPLLSHELAACFVGPFPLLCTMGPVFF